MNPHRRLWHPWLWVERLTRLAPPRVCARRVTTPTTPSWRSWYGAARSSGWAGSTSQRRGRLIAALGFLRLRWAHKPQVVSALESWLNSWLGIGDIIVGMHAQGYDIQLQQYPEGWRANFYTTGIAHSVVTGSAYQPTPWRAVQGAAWEALMKRHEGIR